MGREPLFITFIAGCCLMGIVQAQSLPTSAQISGRVIDDGGNPVPNAVVTATTGSGLSHTTAVTTTDGSFRLSGLGAGTARICVQVPGTALLDPCHWSNAAATLVTLAVGQSLAMQPIQLQTGYPLTVRVYDDTGALAANEGKKPGAHLLVGLWLSTGLFVPATVITVDSKGRYYGCAIPFGTTLQLSVFSQLFSLSVDTVGAVATKSGFSMPLTIPSGTVFPVPTFHVTGLNSSGTN